MTHAPTPRRKPRAAEPPRLTDDELVTRHRTGASLQLLAALSREGSDAVLARLRRLLHRHIPVKFGYLPHEQRELAEALKTWGEEGPDLAVVTKATGLPYRHVLNLIELAGTSYSSLMEMPARAPGPLPCPIPAKELERRYVTELQSIASLARDLGVNDPAVRRWLTEANVPLRGLMQAHAARGERMRMTGEARR